MIGARRVASGVAAKLRTSTPRTAGAGHSATRYLTAGGVDYVPEALRVGRCSGSCEVPVRESRPSVVWDRVDLAAVGRLVELIERRHVDGLLVGAEGQVRHAR